MMAFVHLLRSVSRNVLPLGVLFILIFSSVHADNNADIQAQIDAHNKQITALQQEIAAYQQQLNVLGTQHQTLQSAIKSIDVTKAQTSTQISVTQNQIGAASLNIDKLGNQIQTKEQIIAQEQQALAASLRQISQTDHVSPLTTVLVSDTLADAWTSIAEEQMLQEALQGHMNQLATDKVVLGDQQSQVEATKAKLVALNKDLVDQKNQLDAAERSKQTLLNQTKNQESSYQSLITQKRAQQKAFESELSQLENSLKNVTPAQIPHVGQGILAWPFSDTVMNTCKGKAGALGNPYCITQYFGNTPFASANPSLYNGSGHNAIDIGVPIGTPVKAALGGTVLGTGNTDLVPGCYSFGKWVMVKHGNGLATLYAHLSQIGVSKGQAVSTGDTLGLSGMTGYATGPHLHFGVYASAGVQIMTLQQYRGATTPCANATMPVAPKDAYLNPLSYL